LNPAVKNLHLKHSIVQLVIAHLSLLLPCGMLNIKIWLQTWKTNRMSDRDLVVKNVEKVLSSVVF